MDQGLFLGSKYYRRFIYPTKNYVRFYNMVFAFIHEMYNKMVFFSNKFIKFRHKALTFLQLCSNMLCNITSDIYRLLIRIGTLIHLKMF